jgi:putative SOS response-associated peptidase YedK
MCGRFANLLPNDAMAQLFAAAPANDLPKTPNYNICPTNQIHVVSNEAGQRRLGAMRWGFIPRGYKTPADGPLLINARAETLAEKPAFRDACRSRRCLIPASGFYEWTKDAEGKRLPWYITSADATPLAMAGVWQSWGAAGETLNTCAIITTKANAALSHIHTRMPVIVAPGDWPLWLGEAGHGAARLMRPAPDDALKFWRVSPAVNSSRARGAGLIAPVSPSDQS